MLTCDCCGATDELVHTCNHCRGKFCPQHTLPENHSCPALRTDAFIPKSDNTITIGDNTDTEETEEAEENTSDSDSPIRGSASSSTDAGESEKGKRNADHTQVNVRKSLRTGDDADDSATSDSSINGPKYGTPSPKPGATPDPDYESSPDVAADGTVVQDERAGDVDQSALAGLIADLKTYRRVVTGTFTSSRHHGKCLHCEEFVSYSKDRTSYGLPRCPDCGWEPGLPFLRHVTHRPDWRKWWRRFRKATKTLLFVLVTALVLAAGIVTVVPAIDGTSGVDAQSAGDGQSEVQESSASSSSGAAEIRGSELNLTRVERLVHQYINQERQERDRQPVAYDTELASIAEGHSRDMVERDYYAHESPEGADFVDRYDEVGYHCKVHAHGDMYYNGAENIAYNWVFEKINTEQGKEYYDSEKELARGLVTMWMNSAGHRKNILREFWNNEGIGITITDSNKVYATQNFC